MVKLSYNCAIQKDFGRVSKHGKTVKNVTSIKKTLHDRACNSNGLSLESNSWRKHYHTIRIESFPWILCVAQLDIECRCFQKSCRLMETESIQICIVEKETSRVSQKKKQPLEKINKQEVGYWYIWQLTLLFPKEIPGWNRTYSFKTNFIIVYFYAFSCCLWKVYCVENSEPQQWKKEELAGK